jgi:hypothetical protein
VSPHSIMSSKCFCHHSLISHFFSSRGIFGSTSIGR